MSNDLQTQIAALLVETGHAHHEAFRATDGADPDWPIWYADHARDAFAERFGIEFTQSELIYCLMRADIEHQARSPGSDWAEFYAQEIVEHCAPSASAAEDRLALYYFEGCPFCTMVRSAIGELGIDVELRNVMQDGKYRDELVEARGRATVPVLRITSPDGEERWMPESRDIIHYLRGTYG